MHRGGQEVRSRSDYILGIDCCLLHNMAVQDTRHNTDHYLVLGCLRGATPAAHLRYLGRHKHFPINPPTNLDGVDRLFAELRGGGSLSHLG